MPIYEFYCEPCHTVFNFLARRVNTEKVPACPKCDRQLQRQMSSFATIGRAKEAEDELPAGFDEHKLERALGEMVGEAEGLNEDDPGQMAKFMRKFTEKSGLDFGGAMEEAISRMEAGDDPDQIEQEMGDIFDGETPLAMLAKKTAKSLRPAQPYKDETLYEL